MDSGGMARVENTSPSVTIDKFWKNISKAENVISIMCTARTLGL